MKKLMNLLKYIVNDEEVWVFFFVKMKLNVFVIVIVIVVLILIMILTWNYFKNRKEKVEGGYSKSVPIYLNYNNFNLDDEVDLSNVLNKRHDNDDFEHSYNYYGGQDQTDDDLNKIFNNSKFSGSGIGSKVMNFYKPKNPAEWLVCWNPVLLMIAKLGTKVHDKYKNRNLKDKNVREEIKKDAEKINNNSELDNNIKTMSEQVSNESKELNNSSKVEKMNAFKTVKKIYDFELDSMEILNLPYGYLREKGLTDYKIRKSYPTTRDYNQAIKDIFYEQDGKSKIKGNYFLKINNDPIIKSQGFVVIQTGIDSEGFVVENIISKCSTSEEADNEITKAMSSQGLFKLEYGETLTGVKKTSDGTVREDFENFGTVLTTLEDDLKRYKNEPEHNDDKFYKILENNSGCKSSLIMASKLFIKMFLKGPISIYKNNPDLVWSLYDTLLNIGWNITVIVCQNVLKVPIPDIEITKIAGSKNLQHAFNLVDAGINKDIEGVVDSTKGLAVDAVGAVQEINNLRDKDNKNSKLFIAANVVDLICNSKDDVTKRKQLQELAYNKGMSIAKKHLKEEDFNNLKKKIDEGEKAIKMGKEVVDKTKQSINQVQNAVDNIKNMSQEDQLQVLNTGLNDVSDKLNSKIQH